VQKYEEFHNNQRETQRPTRRGGPLQR
jgi:hypothetical protein